MYKYILFIYILTFLLVKKALDRWLYTNDDKINKGYERKYVLNVQQTKSHNNHIS